MELLASFSSLFKSSVLEPVGLKATSCGAWGLYGEAPLRKRVPNYKHSVTRAQDLGLELHPLPRGSSGEKKERLFTGGGLASSSGGTAPPPLPLPLWIRKS